MTFPFIIVNFTVNILTRDETLCGGLTKVGVGASVNDVLGSMDVVPVSTCRIVVLVDVVGIDKTVSVELKPVNGNADFVMEPKT